MTADSQFETLPSDSRAAPTSVGVVTVATNRYLDHWVNLVRSADQYLAAEKTIVFHVFTDRFEAANRVGEQLDRIKTNVLPIRSLGWPDATLHKFEIFWNHRSVLLQDILIHFDADMRVTPDACLPFEEKWEGDIALVRHPGFRRPARSALSKLYRRHPELAVRDVYRMITEGGLGTWENDPRSRAFVSRRDRSVYVCGGTWMGRRDSFLNLCQELGARTRQDKQQGVVARFHDESHLNWFAARRKCSILDSSYCYAEGLPNLSDLQAQVVAVEKYDDRTR